MSMSLCFVNKFFCIIFQIPHLHDIMVFLSLTDSTVTSRSLHVAANSIISFLLCFISPLFICTHLYPFLCPWTFRCFHILAIVNSAAKNSGVHISFQTKLFSRYMPRSGTAGLYANFTFSFLRNLYTVLHCGCLSLHSPPVWEGSFFPTPSPAFFICRLFDDSHSDQCEVIPHCRFDLHFSNNQ